jgi:hypothetical protein
MMLPSNHVSLAERLAVMTARRAARHVGSNPADAVGQSNHAFSRDAREAGQCLIRSEARGTTGLAAERMLRNSVLIELNPAYCQIARDRIRADGGKVECALPDA